MVVVEGSVVVVVVGGSVVVVVVVVLDQRVLVVLVLVVVVLARVVVVVPAVPVVLLGVPGRLVVDEWGGLVVDGDPGPAGKVIVVVVPGPDAPLRGGCPAKTAGVVVVGVLAPEPLVAVGTVLEISAVSAVEVAAARTWAGSLGWHDRPGKRSGSSTAPMAATSA